jgi:hypothetical protein
VPACERVVVLGAPRERVAEHLAQRPLGVDGPRVDVSQRVLAREPPARLGVTLLLAHEVDQVGRVAGVEQAEVRGQAERGGVRPQAAMGDCVKRPARDPPGARVRPGERRRAVDHLAGSAPGEREQQDPLGGDAVLHQPGDACAQRRRLARARSGEHEQMTVGVPGRGPLLGVEVGQPCGLGRGLGGHEHRFEPP